MVLSDDARQTITRHLDITKECEAMTGRIDKVTKARLEGAGQWQAFQERRDELKTQGYTPDDARTMAMAEVLAECSADDDGPPGEHRGDTLPVAPDALAGRMAGEPEVARWVARNIDNPEPDPETCPDAFAWTLLRMCRESPAFTLMFVKEIWVKLLVSEAKRDDGGTTDDGEMDGQHVIDLIARIRAISEECKGRAGTVSMPTTGNP